jgi:hypothetical protein
LACGEPISADKTKRPTAATDDNPLFHCSNLQGVILGVGLSMLEQLFSEQNQEIPDNKEHKARMFKRRKTDSGPDYEDEDSGPFSNAHGQKKRGGTGYAGDQKEDVCLKSLVPMPLLKFRRIPDSWRPKPHNGPKMRRLETFFPEYVSIFLIFIAKAAARQAII